MVDPGRVRISFWRMLGYVLPAGVLAGAMGAYPTWRAGGAKALAAELAAGAIALAVMITSGLVVVRSAAKGPIRAALVFAMSGLVRAVACLVLAAGAWAVFALPPLSLGLWLLVFYLVMLVAEVVWLSRAMHRGMDAEATMPGETR